MAIIYKVINGRIVERPYTGDIKEAQGSMVQDVVGDDYWPLSFCDPSKSCGCEELDLPDETVAIQVLEWISGHADEPNIHYRIGLP